MRREERSDQLHFTATSNVVNTSSLRSSQVKYVTRRRFSTSSSSSLSLDEGRDLSEVLLSGEKRLLIIPLLSAVHDILLSVNVENAPLSSIQRFRGLMLCNRICKMKGDDQSQVLATLIGATILREMNPEEARSAISKCEAEPSYDDDR